MPIMAITVAGSPWLTSARPLPTRWMVPASDRACCDAGDAALAIAARLRIRRFRTSISERPSLLVALFVRTHGVAATLLIVIEIAFLGISNLQSRRWVHRHRPEWPP